MIDQSFIKYNQSVQSIDWLTVFSFCIYHAITNSQKLLNCCSIKLIAFSINRKSITVIYWTDINWYVNEPKSIIGF